MALDPAVPWTHRAAELLLRLPPLYFMDTILVQQDALIYGGGTADDGRASVTMTDQDGRRMRVSEAPKGFYPNATFTPETWDELRAALPDGDILSRALNLLLAAALYVAAAFVLALPYKQLKTFYLYFLAAASIPASYLSHRLLCDTLAQLEAGADPANAEWFVHRGAFAEYLPLEVRAVAADYLVQSVAGFVLTRALKRHFDNPELLTKCVPLLNATMDAKKVLAKIVSLEQRQSSDATDMVEAEGN